MLRKITGARGPPQVETKGESDAPDKRNDFVAASSSTELVFGFAGEIGTDLDEVGDASQAALRPTRPFKRLWPILT